MQDGFYYLCPQCKKFKKEFYETWSATCYFEVKLIEGGIQDYNEYEYATDDPLNCSCECGFRSENYCAKDFIVEIKDGKIIINEYSYWDEFFDDLKEIAKEYNLKVKKE